MPKLSEAEIAKWLPALPAWRLAPGGAALSRAFIAKDFGAAVDFFAAARDVADSEGHHPDLHLTNFRHVEARAPPLTSSHNSRGSSPAPRRTRTEPHNLQARRGALFLPR